MLKMPYLDTYLTYRETIMVKLKPSVQPRISNRHPNILEWESDNSRVGTAHPAIPLYTQFNNIHINIVKVKVTITCV